jgi:hypothetical protein
MMPLSNVQRDALTDYLSRNPKTCGGCGGTTWDYGDIDVYAADLMASPQEVETNGLTYVRITCQSCGKEEGVDCREAGIPEEPDN